MTVDRLDEVARRAAADLRARAGAVDTEQELQRLTERAGGARHRAARLGRPVLVAAVLLAVVGGGALVVARPDGGTTDPASESVPEPDPRSFGPVVATTTGPAGERYELRAHEPLHHGDEVLVSVSGAAPGRHLSGTQCALDGLFNPMTHCDGNGSGDVSIVSEDGTASRTVRVLSRFDGAAGSRWANRCGTDTCSIWVSTVDDAVTEVSGQTPPPADQPRLPLRFAEDPKGPVEPAMSVEVVEDGTGAPDGTPPGRRARIRATGLTPGPTDVALRAYPADRMGPPLQYVGPGGSVVVATVDVGPDGTLDVTVPVPTVVEPDGGTEPPVPGPLVCGEAGVTCDLSVGYVPGTDRYLAPQPVPWPPA